MCVLRAWYPSPYDCPGYRLPTEAEWEYAARAGTATATYNGELDAGGCSATVLDPIAWYCGNSEDEPHSVGSKLPNAWNLYDMLGNVSEWCYDLYGDYPDGPDPVTDPFEPDIVGPNRVYRGGSWHSTAEDSRAAYRLPHDPHEPSYFLGFRPARTLSP